jgi:hypothetical protein
MPKQLYKITQFHGGLNNNSDARDIAENELSEATDVMVDELGKIRMMGGVVAHAAGASVTAVINPGYGLFYFSHDRLEGNDAGAADVAETGADYLVLADTDTDTQFFIYESSAGETAWGGSPTAVIDLYTDGTGTTGVKPTFYAVDGALRVSDGNFGANNANKWYGYIYRMQFGDGTNGVDAFTGLTGGKLYDQWISQDQNLTALPMKSITTRDAAGAAPDINKPVRLSIKAAGAVYPYFINIAGTTQSISSTTQVIRATCNVNAVSDTITMVDSTEDNFTLFCKPGDFLIMGDTDKAGNANVIAAVTAVTASVITVPGGIATDDTSTIVHIANLSRMHWWSDDTNERYLQFAMSTIYDGNQESALAEFGTRIALADIMLGDTSDNHYLDLNSPLIDVHVFCSAANTFGSTYPRVTGFKIYVRRSSSSNSTSDYALLCEVSIADGIRIAEHQDSFIQWLGSFVDTTMAYFGDKSVGDDFPFPSLTKYPYEVGETHTVEGYKTAVVANRMAYIGHVKQDGIVYGDRVLKSEVNKFDSFPASRKLEASVNDGDSIVKLEAYADRLLIFKKNKLELVNISQEVEFLEDTFMHKGVSHPAATCKTDFGIAWVNEKGCYLYDGQKVNNLLEKQGRQIIKESVWSDFVDEPMIGYLPKKRQIIVADDITTTGDGAAYLYDIVTQSWVKGAAATITDPDQAKTNFITDWNGDLVYAHTAGTLVKWDDAGEDSTDFVIQTKDIDFGQPAQKKKIYKVYVTYTGVSSLSVDVDYQINGDNGWNGFASGEPLIASSGQNEATLTLSSPVECYSFQLRFSGTGKTAFEINDATIVFRLKGQR